MVALFLQALSALAALCTIAGFVRATRRDHVQRARGKHGKGGDEKGRE